MQEREKEGCCFMNKGHVLYCILSAASILVKAVYIYCCCPLSSSLAQISSAPSSIPASQQLFASTFASCKRLVIDHRKYLLLFQTPDSRAEPCANLDVDIRVVDLELVEDGWVHVTGLPAQGSKVWQLFPNSLQEGEC
jgi:hypothetical protein